MSDVDRTKRLLIIDHYLLAESRRKLRLRADAIWLETGLFQNHSISTRIASRRGRTRGDVRPGRTRSPGWFRAVDMVR
jgi:hypothetical protein